MKKAKIVRDQGLTDIVVKRLENVFGIVEVVNWKAVRVLLG